MLKRALVHLPNDSDLLRKMGILYLSMNQLDQAKDSFTKLLEQDPEDGSAMVSHFVLNLDIFESS